MSKNQIRTPYDAGRAIKKLFLSAFVLFTFAAYVFYERLTRPDAAPIAAPTSTAPVALATNPVRGIVSVPVPTETAGPAGPTPTALSLSVPPASSIYKNGTFQGQPVDAYYGLVQVQVNIQAGNIQSVQFLQYPSDRRTSQQINSIAMPYLQQEAIQAQSAQVDIISGATLTSEGFQMSLQTALQAARNN